MNLQVTNTAKKCHTSPTDLRITASQLETGGKAPSSLFLSEELPHFVELGMLPLERGGHLPGKLYISFYIKE